MLRTKLTLALSFTLLACLVPALAQQSLGELVAQQGQEWLIGNWTAQDQNGSPAQLTMAWELNKHMISMHRKDARMEIKGMTAIDPNSGDVVYVAVSDSGGAILGKWEEDYNGHPQLTVKAHLPNGESWSGVITFKKVDADTMTVELGATDSSDRRSTTFKRKK